MRTINSRMQRFVDEYIIDCSIFKAAERSGYKAATARRLMMRPEIHAAIEQARLERSKRTHVDQDRVLLEVARIAFNDPRKAFDKNGKLLTVDKLPDDVAACVSSIKVTDAGDVKEIKFWDKGRQLDLAARHLGMLVERHIHQFDVAGEMSELEKLAKQAAEYARKKAG